MQSRVYFSRRSGISKKGTRVNFVLDVQAMYAEALKNICFVKNIPLTRALYPIMGVDKVIGVGSQLFDFL